MQTASYLAHSPKARAGAVIRQRCEAAVAVEGGRTSVCACCQSCLRAAERASLSRRSRSPPAPLWRCQPGCAIRLFCPSWRSWAASWMGPRARARRTIKSASPPPFSRFWTRMATKRYSYVGRGDEDQSKPRKGAVRINGAGAPAAGDAFPIRAEELTSRARSTAASSARRARRTPNGEIRDHVAAFPCHDHWQPDIFLRSDRASLRGRCAFYLLYHRLVATMSDSGAASSPRQTDQAALRSA